MELQIVEVSRHTKMPTPRSILLGVALITSSGQRLPEAAAPIVQANDNRTPAGTLKDGKLRIALVVQKARWYPESETGAFADVEAFAEEGKAPQIPAPLIRVPAGTIIEATVRNDLPDSTVWIGGMTTRPGTPGDSVPIRPGQTIDLRFAAGEAGTYFYKGIVRKSRRDVREGEQLAGAFIVDPPGARADDRIVFINIWRERKDSSTFRGALALNGKSWPYTERISAATGDSVRWRVINASIRGHPMHLHGFYFRVDSRGTAAKDTSFAPEKRRLAVTELMPPGSTMSMVWSPDRPGNWLFHCHLVFHVIDRARLDFKSKSHDHGHDGDPMMHMSGLVMGITVRDSPRAAASVADLRVRPRKLRLFANERARNGLTEKRMSYVLQRNSRAPATDSVEPPGAVIVVRRNEPTDITVINRMHTPTSVHWHGIELESYFDGVAGWSGASDKLAPMIAPNDSFVARLTLPRAGTFIYHTHLNDVEQLTSGAYGAMIVLEPGKKLDPKTDHTIVVGWDGTGELPRLLLNGDSLPPPLELKAGKINRLRLVNIGVAGVVIFALRQDGQVVTWHPRAKDGADLQPALRKPSPAMQILSVGETFDAEIQPKNSGNFTLTVGPPNKPETIVRRVIVR